VKQAEGLQKEYDRVAALLQVRFIIWREALCGNVCVLMNIRTVSCGFRPQAAEQRRSNGSDSAAAKKDD